MYYSEDEQDHKKLRRKRRAKLKKAGATYHRDDRSWRDLIIDGALTELLTDPRVIALIVLGLIGAAAWLFSLLF